MTADTITPATAVPLADRTERLVGSVIDSSTSLLATRAHDIVRFAMGSPADEFVPVEDFRRIAAEDLHASSFAYGATEGEPRLLEALLATLEQVGSPSDPERITITAGGMQGLDLACKLFVDPGDLVVVESPTYTNGSATALGYGAELLEVPMDTEGMDMDELERLVAEAGRTPKAIYTVPTFQNPSGVTMSLRRRYRLIELARAWGSVIIDDDPYGWLHFEGVPTPGLAALSDHDPLVFSVRTFSKVIAPGLRVGWVDADPSLRRLCINAKQAMDTCTNVPNQHLVAGFLERGLLPGYLQGLRREYRSRKQVMLGSLERHLGGRVRRTDPDGGFFTWVTLLDPDGGPSTVDTRELFEVALAEGVAFIPGPALSAGGRFSDALRLCFASMGPERTEEGVRRLAAALDRYESLGSAGPTGGFGLGTGR